MTRAEFTSRQVKPSTQVEGKARRRTILMKAANDNRAPLSLYAKKMILPLGALILAVAAINYGWSS